MSQCPFHSESTGVSQEGEIESIRCSACGEYRISKTALDQLHMQEAPSGWLDVIGRREVVSTRDTRALALS